MAIDPITSKIASKAIVQFLTDSEARKKVLMLVLAPIIGILLLIAMILHILTAPFAMLGSLFNGNELKAVENMRADAGYTQLIDQSDEVESIGQSYDGVMLTSPGATEIVYYNQMDNRWSDIMYGKSSTIGQGGCGPTSMAMVITSLTGVVHDPVELAKWSVKHGHRCEGNGSYHSLIPNAAKAFKLKVEGAGVHEGQKIINALASGKLVVAIMGKGHFTSSGHYIVLRGVTENGRILVADPASKKRSEKEWELSIILKEARRGASAGGPFWCISL